jgi:hypothetical protein
MLTGYIDAVTSSGFVEGWAYDSEAPTQPLTVSVQDREGAEVAWGLAHRYREDLVAAHCGIGWCAFQLRVAGSVSRLRKSSVVLLDHASRSEIHRVEPAPYAETGEALLADIADLAHSDPTVINHIEQLRGCEELFGQFIRRQGVDVFVRSAYVYVLGRPVDAAGRARYGRLLRTGGMTPYNLLRTLYDSDEFRSRSRLLHAPNTPAFPFHNT